MKTIFTHILIAGILFLTYVCMSQPVTGILPRIIPGNSNDLRDKKMKEMLKTRKKHFQAIHSNKEGQSTNDINAPDWNWAITLGGKGGAAGSDIACDAANNYYVIGDFNGIVTFGSQTKTSSGLWDVFLAKYNSSGSLIWLQQISTETNQSCHGMAISLDAANNIYISGHFNGTIHFGASTLTTSGNYDAFTARYDNGGNFIWGKKYGSLTDNESVAGMATDPNGNTYIAGNSNIGQFLVKYTADGQYLWETHTTAHVTDITYNSSGIFLTGYIVGTTTFGSITLSPSNGWSSSFFSMQDQSGTFIRANYVESSDGGSSGTSILVDNSGYVYTAGWFEGTVSFIPASVSLTTSNYSYFIAMYDLSGICLGAIQVTDNYLYYNDFQIFPDKNNNLYMSGTFDNNFTFGTSSLTGTGTFIAKIDHTYNPLWAIKDANTHAKTCISGNDQIVQTGSTSYNFFLSSSTLSGVPLWKEVTTSDGGLCSDYYSIAFDTTGNSYLHGYFSGTVNFLGTSVSGTGAYITKISGDHMLKWVKTLNLSSTKEFLDASGIITDKDDNSYAWGTFSDSLYIEGTLIINPSYSGTMGYLVKYDKDGNYKWVRTFSCTSSLYGTGGITTDATGNILIAGQYYDVLTIGSYTFPATSGDYNSFFAKYSTDGGLLFAKTYSGTSSYWYIWARSIACDKQNNTLISGQFYGTVNFGTTNLTALGGRDIFTAKYDSSGNELWAKDAGSSSSERSSAVATDNNGNVYITGFFNGQSISFDGITITSTYMGGYNLFVAKYSPNGTALWAKALQCTGFSWPLYQLGIDQNGDCYVGGQYSDTLKFDNGPLITGNPYSLFVAKYSTNGDFEWCKNLTGNSSESSGLFATAAVNDKTIYVAGVLGNDVMSFGNNTIASANTNAFLALLGNQVGIPTVVQTHYGVELFPNPASHTIYLEFDEQPKKSVSYSLSDLRGKILMSNISEGSKRIEIILPDLSKGVYFISIKNGIEEYTRKIIID